MSRVFFVQIALVLLFFFQNKRERDAHGKIEKEPYSYRAEGHYSEHSQKAGYEHRRGKREKPDGYSVVSSSVRFRAFDAFEMAIYQFKYEDIYKVKYAEDSPKDGCKRNGNDKKA